MSMDSTNIIVTGGAGYIGSHTCKALAEAGYTPVTYDNMSMGHEWAVQWGPLEKGDIRDTEKLSSILKKHNASAVIHFAALAYVGESVLEPAKYWQNNVAGTLSILKAMAENGVSEIVFSSTCATYGSPQWLPLKESHPQDPINPYGTTKLVVENMFRDFAMGTDLNSVSLRYFNAAGADPENQIGEDHNPETHLIPLAIAATGSGKTLTVFGDDYDTPDGSCIRDYIHVTDLADAHVKALRYLKRNAGTHAFNLGNDTGHSVLEIINAIERVAEKPVSYEIGPRRPGDPASLVSDSSLARSELGWTTTCSNIETIVQTAWNWYSRAK